MYCLLYGCFWTGVSICSADSGLGMGSGRVENDQGYVITSCSCNLEE